MTAKASQLSPKLRRVFTLRLPDPLFEKLEYIATVEYRSLSNTIEFALVKFIQDYEDTNGEIPIQDE